MYACLCRGVFVFVEKYASSRAVFGDSTSSVVIVNMWRDECLGDIRQLDYLPWGPFG